VLLREVTVPPEVLAWALLFVVAFGIVYRFFSWLGRRLGRQSPIVVAPHETNETLAEAVRAALPSEAPPQSPVPRAMSGIISSERAAEIHQPTVSVAPPLPRNPVAAQPNAAAPLPQQVERPALVSTPTAPRSEPPRPAPASHYATTASPVAAEPSAGGEPNSSTLTPAQIVAAAARTGNSSAVMSVRAAAAAAAAIATRSAAPSRSAVAPSVAATLAPRPTTSTPAAEAAARPPEAVTRNGSDAANSPPVNGGQTSPRKSNTLRARRIGAEFPSLDVRLKDSRSRKTLPTVKTSSKPLDVVSEKAMKVLARGTAPEKTPVRRIGQKVEENALASTKSQTRIVGVPQRAPRVLFLTSL
jgi:hypothetical protein